MLDESIIDNAPSDPVDAFFHYLEYFYKFIDNNCDTTYETNYAQITIANSDSEKTLGMAIDFYALLNAQVEECGIEYNLDDPNPSGDPDSIIDNIYDRIVKMKKAVEERARNQKLIQSRDKFRSKISKQSYKFNDNEHKQLQDILNDMRQIIVDGEFLAEEHKRRVLNKLEKLQEELHKSVSDLSVLYGRIVEASEVVGKVGRNIDPFTNRAKEFIRILQKKQDETEGLPESNDGLPGPNSDIPALDSEDSSDEES